MDSQHGLRQNRSCLCNLLEFFHYILSEFDSSRVIDFPCLDFQKALNKMPHQRLMLKVSAFSISMEDTSKIKKKIS